MGLFDFFKKGQEKPVQQKPAAPPVTPKPNPAPVTTPTSQATVTTPPVDAQPEFYTVKSGDSLSKIAKQVYGDAQQWNRIFEANRDQIKEANLIHPGQKIKIPR